MLTPVNDSLLKNKSTMSKKTKLKLASKFVVVFVCKKERFAEETQVE